MKKKAPAQKAENQKAEAQESAAPRSKAKLQMVKGIKNTLFKAVPIGGQCVVAGVVRDVAQESGNYGDYWQFRGDFAASIEGTVFKAGTLYMPEVAADILANGFLAVRDAELSRVESLNEGKPETEHIQPKPVTVEFKLRLTKEPDNDERNARGFQWRAEPVKEIQAEQDKVLALLSSND